MFRLKCGTSLNFHSKPMVNSPEKFNLWVLEPKNGTKWWMCMCVFDTYGQNESCLKATYEMCIYGKCAWLFQSNGSIDWFDSNQLGF